MQDFNELEPKHIVWIFQAAQDQYQKSLAEFEIELARHNHMLALGSNFYPHSIHDRKSRVDRIIEIKQWLSQYEMIIRFCQHARNKAVDASAKEFARSFQFFKQESK